MEDRKEIDEKLFRQLERKNSQQYTAKYQNVWVSILKELKANKIAIICLVLLMILAIAVLLAP